MAVRPVSSKKISKASPSSDGNTLVRLTYVPYQISVSFFMHLFPESFLLAAASVLADSVIRTNTIYPDMMFPNSYLKSLIKADWFSFFLQLTSGSSLLFCY